MKIQLLEASRREKFLAAEKSSHHSKKNTLSVNDLAIVTVSSVEPVSTTIISSAKDLTQFKHRARVAASSLTIIQTLNVIGGNTYYEKTGVCVIIYRQIL